MNMVSCCIKPPSVASHHQVATGHDASYNLFELPRYLPANAKTALQEKVESSISLRNRWANGGYQSTAGGASILERSRVKGANGK